MAGCVTVTKAVTVAEFLVRKRGLEPLSLAALAPKGQVGGIPEYRPVINERLRYPGFARNIVKPLRFSLRFPLHEHLGALQIVIIYYVVSALHGVRLVP